jgi:ElaB/YqjD/DUF883 family membrane-anchored ribosome-binding protein
MASGNGAATEVSAEDFRAAFARVRPLMEKEWPAIDGAAIEATAGELDKVVDLVARETEKNRDAVKQQLFELHAKATRRRVDRLEQIVDRLEKKTREIADKVKRDYAPKAEAKIKENLWVSLLVALGLGMLIGLILRLGGRRRD